MSTTTNFLNHFTKPYLAAHQLSTSSFRYSYIFWIVLAGLILIWSLGHQFFGWRLRRKIGNPQLPRRGLKNTDSVGAGSMTGLTEKLGKSGDDGVAVPGGGGRGMNIGNLGWLVALIAFMRRWTMRRITFFGVEGFWIRKGTAKATATSSPSNQDVVEGKPNSLVALASKARLSSSGEKAGYLPTTTKQPSDNLKKSTATKATRKPPRKVFASPTYGQVILILALILLGCACSWIGPDYISPKVCLWGGDCSSSAPTVPISPYGGWKRSLLSSSSLPSSHLDKRSFDPDLLVVPLRQIYRNLWTSANRVGLIAYAMIPLAITLSLKQWPFNIWATPWLTDFGFDKTAILHRWIGRVIWVFSTIHTGLWTAQLLNDQDPNGRAVYWDVWKYYHFIFGAVAYAILCIIVVFSFNPIRNRFYEVFYWSHVFLAIAFLVSGILHHPQVGGWCIAGLVIWGAERWVRFMIWLWINGLETGLPWTDSKARDMQEEFWGSMMLIAKTKKEKGSNQQNKGSGRTIATVVNDEQNEKKAGASNRKGGDAVIPTVSSHTRLVSHPNYDDDSGPFPPRTYPSSTSVLQSKTEESPREGEDSNQEQLHNDEDRPITPPDGNGVTVARRESLYDYGPGQDSQYPMEQSSNQPPSAKQFSHKKGVSSAEITVPPVLTELPRGPSYNEPPSGYGLVQLLPGRTIRLTIRTPRTIRWRPGQNVLVTLPGIKYWQSHPYTIVNADRRAPGMDLSSPLEGEQTLKEGSTLVFLIRVRRGFTKTLWKHAMYRREENAQALNGSPYLSSEEAFRMMTKGVVLRTFISLPMGSAGRTSWGSFSTVVIVCGGSGVSFGLAVLEHLTMRMANRERGGEKAKDPSFVTTRVRFVWILKEYAHLAWIAPTLRSCLQLLDPSQIQVDLYVTSDNPTDSPSRAPTPAINNLAKASASGKLDDGSFTPPVPAFVKNQDGGFGLGASGRPGAKSYESLEAASGDESDDEFVQIQERRQQPRRPHSPGGPSNSHPQPHRNVAGAEFGLSRARPSQGDTGSEWDLVMFEGEDERTTPAEATVSKHVKKQGKDRRAWTRKQRGLSLGWLKSPSKRNSQAHLQPPQEEVPPVPPIPSGAQVSKRMSMDISESPLGSPVHPNHPNPAASPPQPRLGVDQAARASSKLESGLYNDFSYLYSSPHSPALPAASSSRVQSMLSSAPSDDFPDDRVGDEVFLDVDEEEREGLGVVAELAKTGKPRLGKILDEEQEKSEGRVLVSCCGPTSLNSMLREMVSERISPSRLLKGDSRGSLHFVCEDFSF